MVYEFFVSPICMVIYQLILLSVWRHRNGKPCRQGFLMTERGPPDRTCRPRPVLLYVLRRTLALTVGPGAECLCASMETCRPTRRAS